MSLSPSPSSSPDSSGDRWNLWVDGCGGFLVLGNSQVSVGSARMHSDVDVGLVADVASIAGKICHDQGEYFWSASGHDRQWIEPGQTIAGLGSAKLRLRKPSALCESALLTLDPPHRFAGHVDAVLLAGETWLIGPGSDCHVRCRLLSSSWVVSLRDQKWWIKQGFDGIAKELSAGQRMTLVESSGIEVNLLLEM